MFYNGRRAKIFLHNNLPYLSTSNPSLSARTCYWRLTVYCMDPFNCGGGLPSLTDCLLLLIIRPTCLMYTLYDIDIIWIFINLFYSRLYKKRRLDKKEKNDYLGVTVLFSSSDLMNVCYVAVCSSLFCPLIVIFILLSWLDWLKPVRIVQQAGYYIRCTITFCYGAF